MNLSLGRVTFGVGVGTGVEGAAKTETGFGFGRFTFSTLPSAMSKSSSSKLVSRSCLRFFPGADDTIPGRLSLIVGVENDTRETFAGGLGGMTGRGVCETGTVDVGGSIGRVGTRRILGPGVETDSEVCGGGARPGLLGRAGAGAGVVTAATIVLSSLAQPGE